MTFTDAQFEYLEGQYWDGYQLRLNELRREQADVFDELAIETTIECRRAGIRRMAEALVEMIEREEAA